MPSVIDTYAFLQCGLGSTINPYIITYVMRYKIHLVFSRHVIFYVTLALEFIGRSLNNKDTIKSSQACNEQFDRHLSKDVIFAQHLESQDLEMLETSKYQRF